MWTSLSFCMFGIYFWWFEILGHWAFLLCSFYVFSLFFICTSCVVSCFYVFWIWIPMFYCLQVSSFDLGWCVILSIVLLFDVCVCWQQCVSTCVVAHNKKSMTNLGGWCGYYGAKNIIKLIWNNHMQILHVQAKCYVYC